MNSNMRKKIMVLFLSGVVIVSGSGINAFASAIASDSIVESETNGETESESSETLEEDQKEEEITDSESENDAAEDVESTDNVVNNKKYNSAMTAEETTEGTLSALAESGTFARLEDLQTFYEDNKTEGVFKDALDFSKYSEGQITANANGLILLSCVENESFEGWTIYLKGLSGSNWDLSNPISVSGSDEYRFRGLGRAGIPFKGELSAVTGTGSTANTVTVIVDTPLFNALDVTSAKISDINSLNIQTAKTSVNALAEIVSGIGQDWSTLEVNIEAYMHQDGESKAYYYPGSCIGTVKKGADFSLKKVCYNSTANVNVPSGNAGLLCNTLEGGAKLTVNSVQISSADGVEINVTSGNAAAGGLIGYVGENAEFSVENTEQLTLDKKWTVTGKNAGAIIGEATNAVLHIKADVNGARAVSNESSGSAGGLMGTYHLTSTSGESVFQAYGVPSENAQVKDVVLDATGENSYIGALFGILELSKDFSIKGGTDSSVVIKSTAGFTKTGSNFALKGSTTYGGLVGQVYGKDSSTALPALTLNGKISSECSTGNDITYYGGLVGIIGKPGIDSANKNGVYVVINDVVSTICNNSSKITAANHYFGGAVGGMFYHSVFEIADDSTFAPTAKSIKYGGGIVGAAARGSTLRLAGSTDLTNVTFNAHEEGQNPGSENNYRRANGQIAGIQNAAVIYAAKSWILTRPANPGEIDDIGNYGSVIRLGNNIGKGKATLGIDGGLSEELISQNSTTHKTVFSGAAPLTLNGKEVTISNADEFALLSIAEQTYGDFGIYPKVTGGHIISGNKINKIALGADIDLSNTGISGLQRDFHYASNTFAGELDGQNHELKLDIGQIYAATGDGTGAGNGQIHGHSQVGLFSQANAKIRNLTITGNINVIERVPYKNDVAQPSSMAVGGCVALSTGNGCTFENVTTNVKIQCTGEGTESYIGGLVGLKQGDNSTVTISDCTGSATINDSTTVGTHAIGGLIGTYTGGGTITVSDTTLNGSIARVDGSGSIADAKYGGMISVIKDNSATVNLNNLIINGQGISNNATTSSGGLLGYEWNNSKVYFGDNTPNPPTSVTVQGESSVTVSDNAGVGALVYQATGYWQVNNLSFTKANIENKTGDLGLLICHGWKGYNPDTKQGAQLLYLEETKHGGYEIKSNDVSVSSTGGFFDEWVVYTSEKAETITDNGNSVISIATKEKADGSRMGFDPTKDTSTGYQNRTTNNGTAWTAANPNARYYYDLDVIRSEAKSNTNKYVDTPGELVLWSVWRYCEKTNNGSGALENSNIQEYFVADDIKGRIIDGNDATIDLTGFSYYPVNVDAADVSIQNCTIKFANKTIEDAERLTGSGLDVMNRKTSGTAQVHTQHYLMHTGIILNFLNTSTSKAPATLSVNSVTLQGTIGKAADGSGAIVCGKVEGSSLGVGHYVSIKLNTVEVDNLKVNADLSNSDKYYAPLLINRVGSYGGIDAQKISATNYNNTKAATSLIGHVGSATATNISLSFYNEIDLNGRKAESIFTHATLLESFQYLTSSSGYYHFNEGEKCTYGREINGTVENAGKQLYYFDTRNEVKDGDNKEFNTSTYLPYVCQTKVTDSNRADTFHELEINIVKPDLDEGCGTYDDPYIIKQAEQLNLVAQYIAGIKTAGWKINIVTKSDNVKTDADVNHKLFVFSDINWKLYGKGDAPPYKDAEVRDYLRNAYYKIADDFEMNSFSGLGNMKYPFRGVIEGDGHKLTVNAAAVASGFINVSYGSVVQNLNITYTGTKILANTQAALNSNAVANESYFGGIIGDVKGGDNLVNNVSVIYADSFRIGVQNHLQCVGGFLGIVEGGGVIFSDMPQPEGIKTSQVVTTLAEKDQAYISPLVGRVLDGFAINETTTTEPAFEVPDNPDKNYSIGNISKTASLSVDVQDTIMKVEIDKAEELLLLSAIINSGACNGGWSLAYKTRSDGNAYIADSGKVRNADYSKIGDVKAENFKSSYFDASRKDDTMYPNATSGTRNLPYLITKHAGENSRFWNLCLDKSVMFLDLSIIKDLDMAVYKNGYRGIGGRYNCTASSSTVKDSTQTNQTSNSQFQRNTPSFAAFNGNNHTIKVDNRISGYSDDNFVAIAAGGLVNMLRREPNTELVMQDLTVEGNVELHDFSDTPDSTDYTNASNRKYAASVGGVIGRYFTEEGSALNITYLNLNKLKVKDMSLYSDGVAGGIVGQTGTKNIYPFGSASNQYASGVTYTNCSYVGLTAISCSSTGGIVGAACDNANSFNYSDKNSTDVTNKIIAMVQENETGFVVGKDSTLSIYAKTVDPNGLGGLIGNVGSNTEINDQSAKPIILDTITLQDKDNSIVKSSVSRTGGAIGFLHHGTTKAYNITVSDSTMGNGKEDNLGGIVGCWYSSQSGGIMENIVIDGCNLDADLSVGGVIGYIENEKRIKNITVKNAVINQNSTNSGRGVGLIVGQIKSGGIYGENVLLKDNSITAKTSSEGRLVGSVDSKDVPIQILGVSLQYGAGNSLPQEDIGSIPYADYSKKTNKIFIAYDAFLTEKDSASELAGWPSVPIKGIGTADKITGDTATPYTVTGSNSDIGIVNKVNNDYTYIGSNKTYQYVSTSNVDKLVPSIVSTYNANQDEKIANDFKVVQIDGSAACLKQYVNAATNGAFETGVSIYAATKSDSIMNVDIKRYEWNSGANKFEDKTDSTKPTLTYDKATGNFYATTQYDNQSNMFTLVSVTFNSTSGNFKRTYHIPVVVRRMLQVDFMATMASGTVFNAEEMNSYKTHALASAGEEVTGYLTFKYNSNLSGLPATYDWQNYMEAGANLLGYYKKTLDTGTLDLPEDTHITLIDCQQSDRRYYAKVPEGEMSKLELFNGKKLTFKNSDGKAYEPVTLAELLKIRATSVDNENDTGSKKWVRLTEEKKNEATVVDLDGNYYRLYDSGRDGENAKCYTLKITNPTPEENYFVVISVPKSENHMMTLIKSGGVTKGSMKWSGDTAPAIEVHQLHRYTNGAGKYTEVSTNASSEITFNFLENYNQNLVDLAAPAEAIPVSGAGESVEMNFNLKNEISFNKQNYEDSDPLFQELRVSLRKNVDGKTTDVYFPSDANAKVALYAYYVNENDEAVYFTLNSEGQLENTSNDKTAAVSYDWTAGNDGNMILPFAKLTDGKYKYIDLAPLRIAAKNHNQEKFYLEVELISPVTIGISSVINNDLLPARENQSSNNQTKMQFTSVLSFKQTGLSYSTLRETADGKKGYYLNEKREATLLLDYIDVDQLGINVSDEHSGEINTELTLDVSGTEGFNSNLSKFELLNNVDTIEFNFSLKQKGQEGLSSVEYGDVTIGDYLSGARITGEQEDLDSFHLELKKKADGSYPYYNEATGVFRIPITFKVKTDGSNVVYTNYRIFATAGLRKGENPENIALNKEKAFITYTLAKININGIWSGTTDPAGGN